LGILQDDARAEVLTQVTAAAAALSMDTRGVQLNAAEVAAGLKN
jgi:hypothetical protein